MDTQQDTAVPAWEAAKENVLPIKRGRSAKGLSVSLAHPVSQDTLNADQDRAFEAQLENNTVTDPVQRLELYVKYLKWVRDTFPSVTDKALQILEKCTFELKDHEVVKNDVRFVSLWIEYADMVRTPGEIFTYMQSNKIGEKVALFWIAWAYVAEKALNYKLADQIFQKAVRRGPEPKELLNSRYKQFQRRMARLYLNSDTASTSGTDSAHSNATVDAAITAAAMEAIRSAPSVSTAPAAASAGGSDRSVLRKLDGENPNGGGGVREESRPAARANTGNSAAGATLRSRPSGSTSGTASSGSTRQTSAASVAARPSAPNAGFEIFCDNPAVGASSMEGAPAPTWKNLGTEAVRRKENDGPVTKWSEGPLLPSNPSASLVPGPAPGPAISIFVDEQFAATALASPVSAVKASNSRVHGSSPAPHVLSVRKQLDAAEGIAKNPLARHTLAQGAPAEAPIVSLGPSTKPSSAAPKAALGEVSSSATSRTAPELSVKELPVFTSAAPPAVPSVVAPAITKVSQRAAPTAVPNAKPTAPAPVAQAGMPFAIFSDDAGPIPAKTAPVKATGLAPCTAPSAPAFSIYESPTAPAPVATRAAKVAPLKESAGLAFSIYESPTRAAPMPAKATFKPAVTVTKAQATAPSAGIPFNIFCDESPVPTRQQAKPATQQPAAQPTSVQPSAAQKSTLAFSIFESPSQPVPKIPSASSVTGREGTKRGLAPAAPLAFDIYVDESLSVPAAPTLQAVAGAAAPSTPAAHSGVSSGADADGEEHDAELQALLDNMMEADGEDGTINTRLARRDIDMMFCSPTIHRPVQQPSQLASARAAPSAVPSYAGYAGDENSFVLKSAGGLFRSSGDENDHAPSTATATAGPPLSQRMPLRTTITNVGAADTSVLDQEPDFDEFDNEYCTAAEHQGGVGKQLHSTGGVLQKATHRPFGVHLDTFSAVKDLSAIKESSQEFSLCGLMETPGHTGTLGFGYGNNHHTYNRYNGGTGTGGRHDHRASYDALGNMLMDISYNGAVGTGAGGINGSVDISSNSRDSFGSVMAPSATTSTTTAAANGAGGSVFGGFQIFEDAAPVAAGNANVSAGVTTGKRKGLCEQRPYTGIAAAAAGDAAADPLPSSRRRLYTPFESAALVQPTVNMAAARKRTSAGYTASQSSAARHQDALPPLHTKPSRSTQPTADHTGAVVTGTVAHLVPVQLVQHHQQYRSSGLPASVDAPIVNITTSVLGTTPLNDNAVVHTNNEQAVQAKGRPVVDSQQLPLHLPGQEASASPSATSLSLSLTPTPSPAPLTRTNNSSCTAAHSDSSCIDGSGEPEAASSVVNDSAGVGRRDCSGSHLVVSSDTAVSNVAHAAAVVTVTSTDAPAIPERAPSAVPTCTPVSAVPAPLEADTFYSLDPHTFNRLLQHLCVYYQHNSSNISEHTGMRVLSLLGVQHPPCFAFRNKPNTRDTFQLPTATHTARSSRNSTDATSNSSWRVVSNIGRGSYGHAILMEQVVQVTPASAGKRASSGEVRNAGEEHCQHRNRVVFKVDLQRESVLWEAFIHMQIQLRMSAIPNPHHRHLLQNMYTHYILSPTALHVYGNSAVLQMPYCEWGTLITVLRVFMQKGVFSPAEHEFLVAYLAEQMVQAVMVVHSVGILHCDIKSAYEEHSTHTDNWLVSRTASTAAVGASGVEGSESAAGAQDKKSVPEIRVRLIDFGRTLSAWRVTTSTNTAATVGKEASQELGQESTEDYSKEEIQEGEQYAEMCTLYDMPTNVTAAPTTTATAVNSRQMVHYRGDVSCKAYKCQEMQDQLPWSYQIDFHALGNCIHQLLHLQPLTTMRENVTHLGTRGLDLQSVRRQLHSHTGGAAKDGAAKEGVQRYAVPQMSLKRYWNKEVWSVVYLILLNFAAFLPCTACVALSSDAHTGAGTQGESGAVQLLQVVLAALRDLLSSDSAVSVRKAALGKLSACLERVEV